MTDQTPQAAPPGHNSETVVLGGQRYRIKGMVGMGSPCREITLHVEPMPADPTTTVNPELAAALQRELATLSWKEGVPEAFDLEVVASRLVGVVGPMVERWQKQYFEVANTSLKRMDAANQAARERDAARRELAEYKASILRTLRLECAEEEVDDNDWPDDLHAADVIEKHLVRGWQESLREKERDLAEARDYGRTRDELARCKELLIWREPAEESSDLYPGLVVQDDRVGGSITLGKSRLPIWCFGVEFPGWEDHRQHGKPGSPHYGVSEEDLARFIYFLLEQRGEFGRLLLELAAAERREWEREDDVGLLWWKTEGSRRRVLEQLQRCVAVLEENVDD
jgi:hypothetical protein